MKYIIASIMIIVLFLYGQLNEPKFPVSINIILIIILLILYFLNDYAVLNNNIESEIKFRSIKRSINISHIVIPLIWTIYLVFFLNYKSYTIFLILIFWIHPVVDLIMNFIYMKRKPYTVFINDDEIILKNHRLEKRKITDLNQIDYNKLNKKLQLNFRFDSDLTIKTTNFEKDDIKKMIEIVVSKSDYNVNIPTNYN